jgi:hypothetical protein
MSLSSDERSLTAAARRSAAKDIEIAESQASSHALSYVEYFENPSLLRSDGKYVPWGFGAPYLPEDR